MTQSSQGEDGRVQNRFFYSTFSDSEPFVGDKEIDQMEGRRVD